MYRQSDWQKRLDIIELLVIGFAAHWSQKQQPLLPADAYAHTDGVPPVLAAVYRELVGWRRLMSFSYHHGEINRCI